MPALRTGHKSLTLSLMKAASALVFVSTLLAPAVALACPAAACSSCSGGSLFTYLGLFGGGLFAGIGSIALRRSSKS